MRIIFILSWLIACLYTANAQEKQFNLLVGTYTNSCESKGIYVYKFDAETGKAQLLNASEKVINPSFLTVSGDKKNIFSVSENGNESKVNTFKYNAKAGKLSFSNSQAAGGADPCYIINDDKNVLVANYSGGTIAVFKKQQNGNLEKAAQIIKHEGKSANSQRQESPHVHMVHFTPDKKYVLANDLGTDRIYVYNYNADASKEILTFKDTIPIKTGSGPRHLTFHPNGKFVYLLQELEGSLTVFAYADGRLKKIQEASVVQQNFMGETSAADIHISDDGKFLYATNRGEANTISLFAIQDNGKIIHKNTIPTSGKGPRNFAIDPTGNYLLIAHQYSNDVIVFNRNTATGELTNSGNKIEICSPVCLVFD